MIIHRLPVPTCNINKGYRDAILSDADQRELQNLLIERFGTESRIYLSLGFRDGDYACAGLVARANGTFSAFSSSGHSSLRETIHSGCRAETWPEMRRLLQRQSEIRLFSEHIHVFEMGTSSQRRLGARSGS